MSWTRLDLRRRFLFWFSGNLQCALVNVPREKDGPELPYLERYRLLELPRGWKIYLHRFVFSDPERGYHNHPWDSFSFPLVGQYLERIFHPVKEKRQVCCAGSLNTIPQEKFHRVDLLTPDAWTLFFRKGTANGWGFMEECESNRAHRLTTAWVFSPHQEQPNEVGGWSGVPLGKHAGRQPFRAHDRGHCMESA